ncbi:hypothetical protein MTE2_3139 [Klebsiella pneumoniae VA360]|nr:hypothetical protein MTE1_4164 [Klebsiella pneumoniae JHCK1]EMI38917.1 hypothetical protein MTE2_3139 [Klebsiella pneumoniae VA360]
MHEHHKSSLLLVENQHCVWVHHILQFLLSRKI